MSEQNSNNQNSNNDDWSNRNWQDARNFNQNQNSSSGFGGLFGSRGGGLFGGFGQNGQSGYGNNNYNGNGYGNNGNNSNNYDNRSIFGGAMPGSNSKIGGNWMRGRNSIGVIIAVLVIIIIYTFYSQAAMNATITKSTIERTKIETAFDSENDECFTDLGTTVEDEKSLRNSFKTFHNATGVIPYVYILALGTEPASEDLNAMAEKLYAEKFTDEDHFLMVFYPQSSTYSYGICLGDNAKTVMDAEALQIFTDYLTKFYDERQTNNQTYLVNTYNYSSDRIMSTKNYSTKTVIAGCIVIGILILVIIIWLRKKRSQADSDIPRQE